MLATVLKGLLEHTRECGTQPSLISAPFLASELGIQTSIDDKVRYRRLADPPQHGDRCRRVVPWAVGGLSMAWQGFRLGSLEPSDI